MHMILNFNLIKLIIFVEYLVRYEDIFGDYGWCLRGLNGLCGLGMLVMLVEGVLRMVIIL